ncbi:MAG: hypothetical protein HYY44_01535 [Deltaproteobacteria bacterium]|nr:hypothetical protein [Deltaproteobacteria bacterium]MBI4374788.1 hypothetical protein [Deltaproteobacteria bacterium]
MQPLNKKKRLVKRYPNRKLYDTLSSRYVTLEEIADMIREGEDVQVIDNKTQNDLTSVTLTQIIFEQEKQKKSLLPLPALRSIIQSGGEKIVDFVQTSLSSGVSSISHVRDEAEKKLKTAIESVSAIPSVQTEIRALRKKIDFLESQLKKYEK